MQILEVADSTLSAAHANESVCDCEKYSMLIIAWETVESFFVERACDTMYDENRLH